LGVEREIWTLHRETLREDTSCVRKTKLANSEMTLSEVN